MIESMSDSRTMVMGLGVTGLSVARYLRDRNEAFTVWDRDPKADAEALLREACPESLLMRGDPDRQAFEGADTVIVSPGVPLDHPALCAAREAGAQIYGDVELFAHEANAPVLGITGSNGKTTVTLMLAALLEEAGVVSRVGGNLGIPALSLLEDPPPDVYVLELSSFQLEATDTLTCEAACLLNISPDHLDRHGSFAAYREVKHRLYRNATAAIYNRDDPDTRPGLTDGRMLSFGLDAPVRGDDFGIRQHDGLEWLSQGRHLLLPCKDLSLPGQHNCANALAALALADAYGVTLDAVVDVLRHFQGPPHRLQKVAAIDGIDFYNDSKATNMDSMQAALRAFDKTCVLIAGGQAKQGDFSRVTPLLKARTRAVILIGEAAEEMAQVWGESVIVSVESDMDTAVRRARELACAGDCVLLSPGCASFDQYENFEVRGDDFIACVRALEAGA